MVASEEEFYRSVPVLRRARGVFEGVYRHEDGDGVALDRHRSRLTRWWNGTGFTQRNEYFWDDGRNWTGEFTGAIEGGVIRYDNARMQGEVRQFDDSTLVLHWIYKERPNEKIWEMIQMSEDGRHRGRVWQWFRDGELFKRTLIKERRVD